MADTSIWMPTHIGDYMKETIGFTPSQHGVYHLCCLAYWLKAGVPFSSEELQSICASRKDFERVVRNFELRGHRYHHIRLDRELEKAANFKRMAELRSKRANDAKYGRT